MISELFANYQFAAIGLHSADTLLQSQIGYHFRRIGYRDLPGIPLFISPARIGSTCFIAHELIITSQGTYCNVGMKVYAFDMVSSGTP